MSIMETSYRREPDVPRGLEFFKVLTDCAERITVETVTPFKNSENDARLILNRFCNKEQKFISTGEGINYYGSGYS